MGCASAVNKKDNGDPDVISIDVICIAYAYLHLPICICLHAREARRLARDVQRRAPVGGGEVEQAAVLLEPGLGLG